jgi:hypothetical protein
VLGVVIWLAKETKGLSLEQIDILWASEEYKATNGEAQTIEVGTVLGFLVYMRPTWIEEFERLVCVRLLHALADGCIEYLFQDLGCR